MRLELSEAADRDLQEILIYSTERFGETIAVDYAASFASAFALLERYPHSGEAVQDGRHRVRRLRHRSHRLFYEVGDDRIVVLRILHYARSLDGRF